jgi:glycosyltransferase involved in cell wall biosynthesis
MRLLILTPEYEGSGGGIMRFYQSLVPALVAKGVTIRIIEGSAFHAAEDKSLRLLNGAWVETLEVSRLHRWHARFGHLAALPGLRRHLAASWAMWEQARFGEDSDVVEACDWGLLFVPAALEAARPLVVQCHGSVGQIAERDPIEGEETQGVVTRLLEATVLVGVDDIQTLSVGNADDWRQHTGRNVDVIRPAWDSLATHSAQQAHNRGLVVGRVQRWKGPQVLCAAMKLLGNRAPEIDWVGLDTSWKTTNSSTSAHLSTAYSGIWGKKIVPRSPVPALAVSSLQAAALFNLVPSTWDVFNLTVVEAMTSGRPTIVSTGAGASELIQDGVNGYTFPSDDAEGLAACIDRVLTESPARLADVGQAAQATVREALDPHMIATQRVIAYESTIVAFRERCRPTVNRSLAELCRPTDRTAGNDALFLDQIPLRTLIRHVARRVGAKTVGLPGSRERVQ